MKHGVLLPLLLALSSSCSGPPVPHQALASQEPAAPLALMATAFEAAGQVELPEVAPGEYEGLHNVFQLSRSIISGGEPQGEVALEQLAAWGVKTILSVDGKIPDVETAAELGMRYVHIPIQYSGISDLQVTRISKTFRELDGPFYVHCFHGRHRGPAAAALGRIVLDGVPREQAIAEMRQWCATSSKYEGLYSAVATAPVPSPEATALHAFDFNSAHTFRGLRAAMIPLPRHWDRVLAAAERDWVLDPEHPDIVPAREVVAVRQILDACVELPQTRSQADDFRVWLEQAREGSERLTLALEQGATAEPGDQPWRLEAAAAVEQVRASCAGCHGTYRNQ